MDSRTHVRTYLTFEHEDRSLGVWPKGVAAEVPQRVHWLTV